MVASVVGLYSLARSAQEILTRGTNDLEMVVLAQHTTSEPASSLTHEDLGSVEVAPGVAHEGATPQVSPEYVTLVWLINAETKVPASVRIRGVDPIGMALHPRVRLIAGRFPERGEPGVVIGKGLAGRFVDLREGGVLHLGRHDWPILGVFQSDDALESQIFCQRAPLMEEFHHPTASVAYVRLESADQRDAFASHVKRIKGLEAIAEPELMQRRMVVMGMDTYVRIIEMLCVLLAVGAVFACLNVMHGSFQSRLEELATLMAMGFTRRRVFVLALQEGLLISLCATVAGLPLAFLIEGKTWVFRESLFYTVHISWTALLVGVATVTVIGIMSSLLAAIQVRRLDVMTTLRGG
jgi:putative ABC transport system permease protein